MKSVFSLKRCFGAILTSIGLIGIATAHAGAAEMQTVFNLSQDGPCKASCVELEVTAEADIYRVRDSAGEIKLVEVAPVPDGSDPNERMASLHTSDQGLAPRSDGCNQVSCTEVIHGPNHTTYVTWDSNGDPVHIEVVEVELD